MKHRSIKSAAIQKQRRQIWRETFINFVFYLGGILLAGFGAWCIIFAVGKIMIG